MKKILIALATVGALASGNAMAQAYVGANVGATRYSVDCAGTTTCDKSDTGFKVYGGWKFMPNLAAELNYFDFGTSTATVPLFGTLVNGEVQGRGVGVGLAFMSDFAQQWGAVARLGIASINTDVSASAPGLGSGSADEDNATFYGGIGISYAFDKALRLHGDLDFSRVEFGGEKSNVRMLSIGVSYSF